MLVIGTDYEYFNAVWVKNEWSRFLDMMKTDKKKTLIPCYKDIDAYDIPNEFRHLQAQDMGKVGFMQDLIRGIGKIIPLQSQAAQNTVAVQQTPQSATVDSLLERAFMFLEEENWEKADEYSEKVLDIAPKNGWAYYCKLLIDLRYPFADDLSECTYNYLNNPNYKKAEKFADGKLKELLESGAKKVLLTGFCGQIAEITAKAEAKYKPSLSKGNRPALTLNYKSIDFKKLRCLRNFRGQLSQQKIGSNSSNLSKLDSTLSTLRTNLQQQQSIYTANAGKFFGKKKAEAAQAEINRLNAEISKAEQKKAEFEAELAKLEAEMKELEAQS